MLLRQVLSPCCYQVVLSLAGCQSCGAFHLWRYCHGGYPAARLRHIFGKNDRALGFAQDMRIPERAQILVGDPRHTPKMLWIIQAIGGFPRDLSRALKASTASP